MSQCCNVNLSHLVLPGGVAGTAELMRFVAQEVSPNAWINIVDQYYPAYLAYRYSEIARRVTPEEYEAALAAARRASAGFRLL